MGALKAIVLGGTNPHIELIKNLKKRGYYTILVDYAENPLAKDYADEHIQESSLDKEKVFKIARDRKVNLVISTCSDQANVTACYVAERLGLPAPYSYQTSLNVTNKLLMKQIMWENNISTSRFVKVTANSQPDISGLRFPLVVKPADRYGSRGVRKANHPSEIEGFLKEALEISAIKEAIIEEYVEGEEISVDCYVLDKKAYVIMLRHKYNIIDHSDAVVQCYASVTPALVSSDIYRLIEEISQAIVTAFELENTSLLVQVVVKDKIINVVEFAPRVGGGLSYRTVKLNTGFDILDATVDSFLGIRPRMNYATPMYFYSTNNFYGRPGRFGNITGYQKLLEEKIIYEFYPYKKRGAEIGSDMASNTRVGSFIIKAQNKDELLRKTKLAIDGLEVYDIEGNPIMRKDIYLKELKEVL